MRSPRSLCRTSPQCSCGRLPSTFQIPRCVLYSPITDRALIDSSEELAPLHALLSWRTLVHEGIGIATLGDLGWTHVTAWRAVIGRAFQSPGARQHLEALDAVTIEYSSTQTPRHSGFSQALLLIGWLAHALEWKSTGAHGAIQEGAIHCSFRKGETEVRVVSPPRCVPR